MEVINIEMAVKKLAQFWREQKISSPPNGIQEILHFEFSKSVKLPDDFRHLYMMTNGMVNLFSNDMDYEGFLFYPLQELTTLEEEFELDKVNYVESCIIFAEYMHRSWWYGVRFSKIEDNYEIGKIPTEYKFKVITRSLGEFIQFNMKDDSVLCDYDQWRLHFPLGQKGIPTM